MTRLLTLTLAFALFATACGGGDATVTDEGAGDEATATTEAQAETTTTTEAETTTTTEAETTTTEAEADAGAEAVPVSGQAIYESNCTRCHSATGEAIRGPALIGINENVPNMQDAFDQIANGGGGMPSFGSRLEETEIQAIVDYIYATF